jgi:hypothetical protein
VLEVHTELKAVLSRLPGCVAVIGRSEPRPAHDLQCPFGSLPLALKTRPDAVPAEIPYLTADPQRLERWRERLDAFGSPRVAVVWAGNPAHSNDRNRSIPLAQLAQLWAGDRTRVVSVQRERRAGDAELLAAAPVLDLGPELMDFDDTAAVLAQCDLVISVDTAVAHLAGALGRPLWVMLPFSADWRWTMHGEVSPWYPAARLFRQPQPGDWDSVVARVAAELPTAL